MVDTKFVCDVFGVASSAWQWIGIPSLIAIATYLWRGKRHEKLEKRSLMQALTHSLSEELAQQRARIDQYDPSVWLALAHKERKDLNEERAMAILHAGVSRTAAAMHEVHFELARYHVSLYPDRGFGVESRLNDSNRPTTRARRATVRLWWTQSHLTEYLHKFGREDFFEGHR